MPSTTTKDPESPFHAWFQGELDDRKWTIADLAREAETKLGVRVYPTGIGQVQARKKALGLVTARYIAAGFGISEDIVMEMGGLKQPTTRRNKEHTYLLSVFDELSEESQQMLIAQAKFLRTQDAKRHHETTKNPQQNQLRGKHT